MISMGRSVALIGDELARGGSGPIQGAASVLWGLLGGGMIADEIGSGGVGSAGRHRQQTPQTFVVRVGSFRWKTAAVLLIVAGWTASYAAALAILLIDGTATDVHWTASQDTVAITAWVVVIGGVVAAAVVGVRWWRRPAVEATGQAITVYQRRPVAIPWTMIAGVPGPEPGGSPGGRGRVIVLADGRELKVPGLDKLASLAAQRQDLPGPAAPAAPADGSLRSWLPFPVPAAWPIPAYPQAGQRRKRRTDQLPGPAVQQVKIGFPRRFSCIMLAPLFFSLMVMFPRGNGGVQPGVDLGGGLVVALVFGATAALVILCCWVTLTRTVAAGPGWLAWRPRLTRRWRILPLADVVSTIDLQRPRRTGVRLSRADGTGLRLRNPELAAGLGAAASVQLAEHPAATAEFLAAVLADAPLAKLVCGPSGSATEP